MHVEDYGPLLRSGGVLLHSVATAQSMMDYSIMAVDEGVVDSPITRAPILKRLNSPSPVWPRSLPHSPPPNREGYTFTKRVLYGASMDMVSHSRFGFYLHLPKKDSYVFIEY